MNIHLTKATSISDRFNKFRSAWRVSGVIGLVNDIKDDEEATERRRGIVIDFQPNLVPMTLTNLCISLASFIPASLFQHLPSHWRKPTLRRNTLSRPNLNIALIGSTWMRCPQYCSVESVKLYLYSLLNIISSAEATFVPHSHNKSGTTNSPEGSVHVFQDGSSKPSPEELEAKFSRNVYFQQLWHRFRRCYIGGSGCSIMDDTFDFLHSICCTWCGGHLVTFVWSGMWDL